jgi:hypothetical protein
MFISMAGKIKDKHWYTFLRSDIYLPTWRRECRHRDIRPAWSRWLPVGVAEPDELGEETAMPFNLPPAPSPVMRHAEEEHRTRHQIEG